MDDINEIAAALNKLADADVGQNKDLVPSGQRPCPICGQKMEAQTFGGCTVDVCLAHGLWLDNGELPAILARKRPGWRADVEALERARRSGKVAGALFGVWSLLLD